jgi:hypothetical protein
MPTQITDDQVAVLRAYLSGQSLEEFERLAGGDVQAFQNLALASLAIVARRFFPQYKTGDVVEAVALLRAGLDDGDEAVDPIIAENLLRYVLGENVQLPASSERSFRAIILLLGSLADGLGLVDRDDIDRVLADARVIATAGESRP